MKDQIEAALQNLVAIKADYKSLEEKLNNDIEIFMDQIEMYRNLIKSPSIKIGEVEVSETKRTWDAPRTRTALRNLQEKFLEVIDNQIESIKDRTITIFG